MNGLITDQNYAPVVESLISSATKEILMSIFCARFKKRNNYQGSKTILEALSKAQNRKVAVNILLHGGKNYSIITRWNRAGLKTFRSFGLRPKLAASEKTIHCKFIIIDGKIAVIGSHNLTESSLTRINEVSVVVEDFIVAQKLRDYFLTLWQTAKEE